MPVAVIVWLVWRSLRRTHGTPANLGLHSHDVVSGLPSLALITAIGLTIILFAAWTLHVPPRSNLPCNRLAEYALAVAVQQLLLQPFLNENLHRLLPARLTHRLDWAIILSALIFALLHAPNPILMLAAALAGAGWCWHFARHRNLAALTLSHFLLGLLAMIYLGKGPLLGLRVGYPALQRLLGQ